MTLLRKEMSEKQSLKIFKEFSSGLSHKDYYKEKPCVVYLECSPVDGVQMVITSEKANKVEKFFTKWLTLDDLRALQEMITESIIFYEELNEQTNKDEV